MLGAAECTILTHASLESRVLRAVNMLTIITLYIRFTCSARPRASELRLVAAARLGAAAARPAGHVGVWHRALAPRALRELVPLVAPAQPVEREQPVRVEAQPVGAHLLLGEGSG